MALTSERKNILKRYIKSSIDKGQAMPEIKDKLKGFGYSADDISSLVAEATSDKKGSETEDIAPAITKSPNMSFDVNYRKLGMSIGGVALLLLLVFIGFYLFSGPYNCGSDRECFIARAQECSPAMMNIDEDGTMTQYQVDEACVMTRSMPKLSDAEPIEIVLLFENKTMTCAFSKGEFDPNLVNTITRGLENCDGDLKDSIYELIIAQYERSLGAI